MSTARRTGTVTTVIITLLVLGAFSPLSIVSTGRQQQIVDRPSVALEFRCPMYILSGKTPIRLRAEVLRARQLLGEHRAKQITFSWHTSAGTIKSGQGKPQIVLDTHQIRSEDIASLEVRLLIAGGPPELDTEKTCTIRIDPRCEAPRVFDSYSQVSLSDEHQHLDNLARNLQQARRQSKIYIIAYAGKDACIWEAEWRAKRARDYLTQSWSIPGEQIITVDGGFQEHWQIELFKVEDRCGPMPTPTIQTDEARINGLCSDKYN
jgi:hypothetical protein